MQHLLVGICVNYAENKLDYADKHQQLTELIKTPESNVPNNSEMKSTSSSYRQFKFFKRRMSSYRLAIGNSTCGI